MPKDRYLVIHRAVEGHYSIWSSYKTLDEIEPVMHDEFREASLGDEYVVIDTAGTGNSIVHTYAIERRVIRREIGALEKPWSKREKPQAYPMDIGDGAKVVRFV